MRAAIFTHPPVILFICLTLFGLVLSSAHAQRQMAITIDDLPIAYSRYLSVNEQQATFNAILAALEEHDVTATGFVNGQRLTREWRTYLDNFVDAGHRIGNHTYSHPDLNDVSVEDYVKDIERGENSIRKWMSKPKFFRYPFLHRGNTKAKREAVYEFLHNEQYVIAPVSIDNDEYRFNQQLVDAKRNGKHLDIRDQYIAHMMERTGHFESMAHAKLQRPVKHILLLHMNYLNGLYLDDLLQAYREEGWEFISLDQALEDSLYSLPDNYVGPKGLSYLERVK